MRKLGAAVFLVLVAAGAAFLIDRMGWELPNFLSEPPRERVILDLWKEKNYQEILNLTEEMLEKNAMDATALTFHGFANFYIGVSQNTAEERIAFLGRTVESLRRARLIRNIPLSGEIEYVLGKAYFHKGRYYYDLSAFHMHNAVRSGYTGDDTYEYLGLAYSGLGRHEESVSFFLDAIERRPTDLLFLTIAQTYFQINNHTAAEEYLVRAINRSSDPDLLQRAHSLLGSIYLQRRDYLKAEDSFLKILAINNRSVEAHFSLGEVYTALGDTVKARASYRRALRIDPNHQGALRRLYR